MFVLFCYDDKLISVAQLSYLTVIWLNTFSWGSVSVQSEVLLLNLGLLIFAHASYTAHRDTLNVDVKLVLLPKRNEVVDSTQADSRQRFGTGRRDSRRNTHCMSRESSFSTVGDC